MKSTEEISNTQDIIDSRDVIARIEYLEGEQETLLCGESHAEDLNAEQRAAFLEWESDYGHELDTLRELRDEAEGCSDWEYGETLIRDSYFEDYAQELASDCCEMPSDVKWPYTCIDWAQAARELKMDYTSVSFDGVEYWIRS